jgi:2-dehydropantoate 2-reductase
VKNISHRSDWREVDHRLHDGDQKLAFHIFRPEQRLMTQSSPRIGIIGSGAVGGYFGYHLVRAGFDVHFLVRSEYEAMTRNGLVVNGKRFADAKALPVKTYRSIDDMPPCDWLLLGAKATSNVQLAPMLARAAAPGAKVICLQNGLGVEDTLRTMLPASLHLIGGLCWLAVYREAPGTVRHIALNDLHLGYHSGPRDDRASPQRMLEEGVAMFNAAGIKAISIPDLTEARWKKLVWNVPFNGVAALLETGTNLLTANPDSRKLVLTLMHEVLRAARACGYPFSKKMPQQLIEMTKAFDEDYLPSMYYDRMLHRPMELAAMYEAPINAAHATGCALPMIDMMHRMLRVVDAGGVVLRASPTATRLGHAINPWLT